MGETTVTRQFLNDLCNEKLERLRLKYDTTFDIYFSEEKEKNKFWNKVTLGFIRLKSDEEIKEKLHSAGVETEIYWEISYYKNQKSCVNRLKNLALIPSNGLVSLDADDALFLTGRKYLDKAN